MKIEPAELSNIIEQNYSHLMPDFFKMQSEYLTSINVIYGDLDASLVAMVITNQHCKKTLKKNNNLGNISFKYFDGNKKIGDIYYDLAKLEHALLVNGEMVRSKKYSVKVLKNKVSFKITHKKNLLNFKRGIYSNKPLKNTSSTSSPPTLRF